ncbi:MAG: IS3 family transposase, partial [Chthoniobacterales bacterium]
STIRYRPKPLADKKRLLEAEIVALSKEHATLGYRKITGLLRKMGYRVNKKQVQRIRREEGLQVAPPRPRSRRQGVSTGLPQKAEHRNHVWAWDFVADYTQRGGKLRVFTLIDEYTRECHVLHSDRSIGSLDVLAVVAEMVARHGAPRFIRSDNGPEFIATAIQRWLKEKKIGTIYIDPGCPWQNGFAESFNSRLRVECLDREVIYTLSEARVVFNDWRDYYNNVRPHRSLGLRTPSEYARDLLVQCPGSGRPPGSRRQGIAPKTNKQHKHSESSH